MGYTSGWSSLKSLKDYLLQITKNPTSHLNIIDHKSTNYGRRLWVAYEYKNKSLSFIALYLIGKHSSDYGYKDMDETMGPSYYDCPLSLINKTTGDSSRYSQDWRDQVKAYHQNIKNNSVLKDGDVVDVYGEKFKIIEKRKRSYRAERVKDGKRFRVSPNQITRLSNTLHFILSEEVQTNETL